jgi:hypothetical protein
MHVLRPCERCALQVTSRLALLEAGFPMLEQTAFVKEDFVDVAAEDCALSVRPLHPSASNTRRCRSCCARMMLHLRSFCVHAHARLLHAAVFMPRDATVLKRGMH